MLHVESSESTKRTLKKSMAYKSVDVKIYLRIRFAFREQGLCDRVISELFLY